MSNSLITGLLLVGIFLFLIITIILRKGRISMKFALVWYTPAIAIIILAIFPKLFILLANMFGFQTISNLVVGFLFVILFLIIIALTVIIAGQTTKINLLIQEVSLMKKKINDVNYPEIHLYPPLALLCNPPTPASWPWHYPVLGHMVFAISRASLPNDGILDHPLLHTQLETLVGGLHKIQL